MILIPETSMTKTVHLVTIITKVLLISLSEIESNEYGHAL